MEIHIGDRVADVTLVNKEGNRVELTIDGKPCVVDIVMAENGSCSILHDGNSYNAELIRGEGGKSYDVNMFYRSYHVDVVDTQAKYLRMKSMRTNASRIKSWLPCRARWSASPYSRATS
jgi:biotin carboxyl carrier protein